jgi:hypothetical protein
MPSVHADLVDGFARVGVRFRQQLRERYAKTPEWVASLDTGASDVFAKWNSLLQSGFAP